MGSEKIYTVIAAKLRRQIMQGDFKDGGVFPSESELTKRFQVTRTTVRHDLDLLVNEGLLLKSQGRRNRVRIRKITKTTWNFASFSEGMRSSHEIPVSKVCKAEIVTTDEGMFFNLVCLRGIDRTAKVQFMTYQKRSAAKTPSFRAEIIARRNSVFNQAFSAGQYIDG